jgi:glycerol kinase
VSYILSIDQGTTSSRAIVFDERGIPRGVGQQEFKQYFPHDAWVEHDPEAIWESTLAVCKAALKSAGLDAKEIKAIGITNQRETTIVWEKSSGKAIYPAIVWQDRRTTLMCEQLKQAGHEKMVSERSGLLLDPYFSASKIAWILENVVGARAKAQAGDLCFGTIDCFLLWRLTGGKQHLTDASNASRTMLFNIHTQAWDSDLLNLFNIPRSLLPEVKDSSDDFGVTLGSLLGAAIPVCGMAGDQQAALIGQACFQSGMAKSTYGTGCFLMLNTGNKAVYSSHQLLTTVAYRIKGQTTYALEGSIFVAGAVVQWLRDSLHLIENASKSEGFAEKTGYDSGVFLVPAFTGLGAPYWDPKARGAIFGLTRDTGIKEIVTAALMSVGLQTADLLKAMEQDGAPFPMRLRIDGGMVNNNWLAQSLADLMQLTVDRPANVETTALGAAYLAGLQAGVYSSLEQIAEFWVLERRFEPQLEAAQADAIYKNWLKAVAKVLTSEK